VVWEHLVAGSNPVIRYQTQTVLPACLFYSVNPVRNKSGQKKTNVILFS